MSDGYPSAVRECLPGWLCYGLWDAELRVLTELVGPDLLAGTYPDICWVLLVPRNWLATSSHLAYWLAQKLSTPCKYADVHGMQLLSSVLLIVSQSPILH
jgi:hypothetical protein